jgi:hypothetical protein
MASIRETKQGKFVVRYRSPDHTQKCDAGCTRMLHEHGETCDTRWQAEKLRAKMAGGEKADLHTGRTAAPKAAPQTTPDFKSAAIDLINRGGPRKSWNERTRKMYRSVLSTQLQALLAGCTGNGQP